MEEDGKTGMTVTTPLMLCMALVEAAKDHEVEAEVCVQCQAKEWCHLTDRRAFVKLTTPAPDDQMEQAQRMQFLKLIQCLVMNQACSINVAISFATGVVHVDMVPKKREGGIAAYEAAVTGRNGQDRGPAGADGGCHTEGGAVHSTGLAEGQGTDGSVHQPDGGLLHGGAGAPG